MSVEKIISDWKKNKFKPVYWLEGDEDYFIDKVMEYAENHILTEAEVSFNLTHFYGKDANWADIVTSCRRYPMFSERQVVLLKEAQQMKDVEKLEAYIENPLSSTVLVVSYKNKKLDGRKKFSKLIKEKGELVSTKKFYERELLQWTKELLQQKELTISPKALALLIDHIGNDLSRIENEIDKLALNLKGRKEISEDDIEKYIGISKDYNVFELQAAFASRDLPKAIRIIQYFEANPKAAPVQMLLPSLYGYFSKVYMLFGAGTQDERVLADKLGVNAFFIKNYITAANTYGFPGVEKALLLLHAYNLKSVGVGVASMEDGSLMKELAIKVIT